LRDEMLPEAVGRSAPHATCRRQEGMNGWWLARTTTGAACSPRAKMRTVLTGAVSPCAGWRPTRRQRHLPVCAQAAGILVRRHRHGGDRPLWHT